MLAHLAAFRRLLLRNIGISAEITATGDLRPVGDVALKTDGALRSSFGPRLHTLVVAEDQPGLDDPDFERPAPWLLRFKGPGVSFHIIRAGSLQQAVERVVADEEERWGGAIPDYSVDLERYTNLIPRPRLRQDVLAALRDDPRGYLILEGPPGFGKSALSAELIRELGDRCVYHWFSDDRSAPEQGIDSLCAQLRRRLALPPARDGASANRAEVLRNLLGRARNSLRQGEQLVLWLDGLDEAKPTDALASLLPLSPGAGIKVVLTSLPGRHLDPFADPRRSCRIDLEAKAATQALAHHLQTTGATVIIGFFQQSGLESSSLGRMCNRVMFDLDDAVQFQVGVKVREALLQEAHSVLRRLSAQKPTNLDWQRDLSVSFNKLGDVRLSRGDLVGAEQAYGQARDIRTRLTAQDAANTDWQRDLSISYERLGDVWLRQGKLEKAWRFFEQAATVRLQLFQRFPDNYEFAHELLYPLKQLVQVHEQMTDPDRARHYRQQLLRQLSYIRDKGWPLDPSWRNRLDDLEDNNPI